MTELDDRPPAQGDGLEAPTPLMGITFYTPAPPLEVYRDEPAVASRGVAPRKCGPLGRVLPARWRWAHEVYAALAGRFWISCPLCLRMFGGHEWGDQYTAAGLRLPGTIPTPDPHTLMMGGAGAAICPVCTGHGLGLAAWRGESAFVDDHRRPPYPDGDDDPHDDEGAAWLT